MAVNDWAHLSVFVGTDTIRHYMGLEDAPLVVGKERYSYFDIARRTGLPAGRTVRIISNLAAEHSAKSLEDLYQKSSPSSIARSDFHPGSATLLMLFRLWEDLGLNIKDWARRGEHWREENDRGKIIDNFTTFHTYKRHELAAERRTAKTAASGPREKGYRRKAMKEQRKQDQQRITNGNGGRH
jgi:hypothetical protein